MQSTKVIISSLLLCVILVLHLSSLVVCSGPSTSSSSSSSHSHPSVARMSAVSEKEAIPELMSAMVVRVSEDGTRKLTLNKEVTVPQLRDNEVLIRVASSAVNRADLLQAQGKYPPPPGASEIIGLEVSGVVVQLSDNLTRETSSVNIGQRVMCLLPGGGYAQFARVIHSHCLIIPREFEDQCSASPIGISTMELAAAIPEAFLTAFQLLFWYGRPSKIIETESTKDSSSMIDGDVVVIHAGASGVGTSLVQYCREFGLRAFVTAGSKEKIEFCKSLGAFGGANYKSEEHWSSKLRETFDGKGADIVLDCVGQSHWKENVLSVDKDATLVSYGFLSGSVIPGDFDMRPLLAKRLTVIGTTLRTRSDDYKSRLVADFAAKALPLFVGGRLRPIVDRVFDMTDAQGAHDYVAQNRNVGKVVLRW